MFYRERATFVAFGQKVVWWNISVKRQNCGKGKHTLHNVLARFQLLSVKLFVEKMARALLSKYDFFLLGREDISNSVSPALKLLQYLVVTAKHLYKHFS